MDENTAPGQLGLNISLSRVNFTDSLFVKNIDISNTLKHDSLDFNIKLADKNAVNQLDLYGLVEFGRDTSAKLKLLPSDIILEHQDWKLQGTGANTVFRWKNADLKFSIIERAAKG